MHNRLEGIDLESVLNEGGAHKFEEHRYQIGRFVPGYDLVQGRDIMGWFERYTRPVTICVDRRIPGARELAVRDTERAWRRGFVFFQRAVVQIQE
jgi:hypothetical protein